MNEQTPSPVHTIEFNACAVSFFEQRAGERKQWLPDVIASALEDIVGRDAEQKSHVDTVVLDVEGAKRGGMRCHVLFSSVASQNIQAAAERDGLTGSEVVARMLADTLAEKEPKWHKDYQTVRGIRPKMATPAAA